MALRQDAEAVTAVLRRDGQEETARFQYPCSTVKPARETGTRAFTQSLRSAIDSGAI